MRLCDISMLMETKDSILSFYFVSPILRAVDQQPIRWKKRVRRYLLLQ